ncbi:hypothetical protein U8V72_14595 [Priestia filamentosa]|uniref:hypothetical protein n=1 Tax=Priestia filamentosa TaxID=1402861 RepID=UPI000588FD57
MNEFDVLNGPFDYETHKNTFTDYLEVIIDETGTIMYATPSHQEKAIYLACLRLNISRQELSDRCPRQYYADYMYWLCTQAKCIAVWNNRIEGEPNAIQIAVLKKLAEEELYYGLIPSI